MQFLGTPIIFFLMQAVSKYRNDGITCFGDMKFSVSSTCCQESVMVKAIDRSFLSHAPFVMPCNR